MAASSDETRYTLLLDKIAEELTSGEVDELVFLLRFHIEGKRNRIAIHGDPRKLLTELQKQNYIGVQNLTLLAEVFELIGRNDLIREIKEKLDYCLSDVCLIKPFIKTLWKFGQRLDSDDLRKSSFRLEWTKEKEDIQKAWQLFEKAFERGYLQEDDFNKLKEFADTIGQRKTLESVMDQDSFISGFVPASSHSGVEDGVKNKNIQGYGNETLLSVKKPTQMVYGQHSTDSGLNLTHTPKAEILQQMPKPSQRTLAQRAELFHYTKPRQNQMTLAERAALAKGDGTSQMTLAERAALAKGDGTSQMTLADKAKLAVSEQKKQQYQHALNTRCGIYSNVGDVPEGMEQARSEDLVFQYPKQHEGTEHTQSPYNGQYQQQGSVLSPDDLSVSPSVALPNTRMTELALSSKIPENHIWPNANTSLMKPSGDFQREERSDNQKEPSQEIQLVGSMSNLNLSRYSQNIHDAKKDKTIQNVEGNTEQRSIAGHSSDEVIVALGQPPVPNETGEFRRSSSTGESTHHVNFRLEQAPIESTSPSDKSNYEGDRRDGQDTNLTGSVYEVTFTNKESGSSGLQEAVDGRSLLKEEVTPLNAVEKVKHHEDETKQGSFGARERLPYQELQDSILVPSETLSTFQEQKVLIPKTPRCGRIIPMKVEEMKKYIGTKIGEGSFGNVYRANMPEGDERKFVIKAIRFHVKDDLYQKSYEKEIHNGRILHPFINPIIARAEDLQSESVERFLYLMYPYMENGDLRRNIDLENAGTNLCTKGQESNSQIQTRNIYQIVHAVDYLHNPINNSFRGPIFHQDLTSHNIFLDGNFNAKIGDFGIAVEAKQNATSATMTRVQGTQGYHPRNMNLEKYNASYDIFSVGVVMLEILTGEEAKLKGKPEYLYEKYGCEGGYDDLIDDLEQRARQNKAAEWIKTKRRDDLAKMALEAVNKDESERKRVHLLQKLDEMRLDAKERYLCPENFDRCVSCYVNSPAKLHLKGKDCAGSNTSSPCQPFCIHCLMNNHINPLVCPQHGKTRPPFGDHVYGVFVAGNNVEGMEPFSYGGGQSQNTKDIAQTFINDAEKVVKVLTAKHPFVLGASAEHLKIVKPNNPGAKEDMETSIKDAFENVNSTIKKALQKNNQNPEEDRLPNSLIIFYFSGHCSKEKGLYLGNAEETLKASITGSEKETQKATTKWIKEMLHEKLGVDHVLVILDCCHAGSQNFASSHGPNVDTMPANKRTEASILQLSSCDISETSAVKCEGSLFTQFLCLGLQGMDSSELGGDTIKCCDECEKRRKNRKDMNIQLPCVKYHYDCVSDNAVTYTSLRDFIQGHFDLLRTDNTSGSGTMTPVTNAQGEKRVFLAYYNPYKSHIHIHLKGSEAFHMYCISSHPESMDKLRKDIINYTLSGKGDKSCDVLTFHQNYGQESYRLIAIHVMYGKHKDEELPSLDSIEKAWSCSHELEACIREDVKGLSHGPVKLSSINKSMVTDSGANYNEEILKISQDYIEIAVKSVLQAEKLLREIKQSSPMRNKAVIIHENFITLIQEVLKTTRSIRSESLFLEKIKENVLRFYLYDEFSVLEVQ